MLERYTTMSWPVIHRANVIIKSANDRDLWKKLPCLFVSEDWKIQNEWFKINWKEENLQNAVKSLRTNELPTNAALIQELKWTQKM
jgi:hypothetical protein